MQHFSWLIQQDQLSPDALARMLVETRRAELLQRAEKAWALRKTEATHDVVAACEELAS